MKVFENEDQFHKKINKNTKKINPSKEQLLIKAFQFHSQGNISEAAKYYQYFINQGFKHDRVFLNYGIILKNLGKLQEAEVSLRKAIDIKPDYVEAYYNLGNILRILGKLEEAKLCSEKIISKRSWSILGSYSFNREMKLDWFHKS